MELIRRQRHLGLMSSITVLQQQAPRPAQPKRRLRSVIVAVSSASSPPTPSPECPSRSPEPPPSSCSELSWRRDSSPTESWSRPSSPASGARRFNQRAEMFRMVFGISKDRKWNRDSRDGSRRPGRQGQRKKTKRRRQPPRGPRTPPGPALGAEHRLELDDEAARFKERLRLEKELMLARALESLTQNGSSVP